VRKEFVPREKRCCEQHHIDREAWQEAGKMGILLTGIPEEYGDGGEPSCMNASSRRNRVSFQAVSGGQNPQTGNIEERRQYIGCYTE
jgi:alkylation response protein AidB-like acyl-CoA dehydrogenase